MAVEIFDLEDLIEIISDLRALGFDIGTQQYIAAQDLLIALAANGELPASPRGLRTWLAPILCSSPREQENFYRYFDRWVAQHPEFATPAATVKAKDETPVASFDEEPESGWTGLFHRPAFLIAAAVVILALAVTTVYLIKNRSTSLAGRVIDEQSKQKLADAQISYAQKTEASDSSGGFSVTYRKRDLPITVTVSKDNYETATVAIENNTTSPLEVALSPVLPPPPPEQPGPSPSPAERATARPYPTPSVVALIDPDKDTAVGETASGWIRYPAIALPLILFGGWWLGRKALGRALLQKLQSGNEPRLDQLVVKAGAGQLFQGPSFRRTIQELRRHRLRGAVELDTPRTIARTISNGGLFTPSYGSRQALPEYLVLIDRASFSDQQARLQNEIMRRLVQENVFVDIYYFQGDPRFCRREDIHAPYVSLQEMAALHPDHHLIVFTDGSSFFNPLTGETERWLEMFASWSIRALMTPEPPAHWGQREWLLAESDFIILPASKEGLAALAEVLSSGAASRPEGDRHTRPFPPMLRQNPGRWLESQQPTPENAQRLCDQLKVFLGTAGYYWLSACAVYPMLHWDLTLYLGFKLLNDREEIEKRLLPLVRLPWFRYGTMPDWLRLKLISGLSADGDQKTRQALEDLLLTILERPADGVRLDIVPETRPSVNFWQRTRERFRSWKAKRSLWQFFKREPPESPLRDYVFLSFMSGKPRKLSVSLPDAVRRLFLPQGQWAMGFRTISLFLVAVVCSLLLFFGWPTEAKGPDTSKLSIYTRMSDQEQKEFLRERLSSIANSFNERAQGMGSTNIDRVKRQVDDYVRRIPAAPPGASADLRLVFGRGINYAPLINRTFSDQGISPMVGLYIAMIESEFDPQFQDASTGRAGLFGFTAETYARDYGSLPDERFEANKSALRASFLALANRNKLGQSPSYLFVVMSYRTNVNEIERIRNEFGPYDDNTLASTGEGFEYVDKFLAAAIIGENPKSFLLDMNPLSSYPPAPPPSNNEQQIAELIAKFNGPERSAASDQLIQLHAQDPKGVVKALTDAILDSGPDAYRVNLYIARTLGSITDWRASDAQVNKLQALSTSANYRDATFKYWLDRAIINRFKPIIECDCQNVESSPADNRTRCTYAEAAIRTAFSETGELMGTCDGSAQGPKATPRGQVTAPSTPTPTPTPPSNASVTLSSTRAVRSVDPVRFTASSQPQNFPYRYRFVFGDGSSTNWQSSSRTQHTYPANSKHEAYVELGIPTTGGIRTIAGSNRLAVTGGFVPGWMPDGREPTDVPVTGLGAVPNLLGKTEAEVRKTLGGGITQFSLGNVTYQNSSTARPDTIIRQSPSAGTQAANGTRIDIVVAKEGQGVAPDELVVVPNVIGMDWKQAEARLKEYNLKASRKTPGRIVTNQDPRPGTKVRSGTTVKLIVR